MMSDPNHNETLEEQKRARQEFLELKKMQHGEMDTGPKPSDVAIVPKTPKEKMKNIWFHDKWAIIGGLLAVILIAVMVAQCANKTVYDLEVIAFTYTPLSDSQLTVVADYMAQYCDDISGDGEVNIQVVNCSYSKESKDSQYTYAVLTKLQAILASDSSALLFITDEESIDYLNGLADSKMFDSDPIKLGEKFYAECGGEGMNALPESLQLSCRTVTGMAIEKDKKVSKFYEQSQNILNALKEDE